MTKEWYYREGELVRGPVLPTVLKELAGSGAITPESLVRKDMHGKWVAASKVKGLFRRELHLDLELPDFADEAAVDAALWPVPPEEVTPHVVPQPILPDSSDFGPLPISHVQVRQPTATQYAASDWKEFSDGLGAAIKAALLALTAVWMLVWLYMTLYVLTHLSDSGGSLLADTAKAMYIPTFYYGSAAGGLLVIWFATRR